MNIPKNKKTIAGLLLCVLSAAAVIFIFSNSLQPASISGAVSGGLLEKVNAFLARAGLPGISEKLLRKTAHICEFGLLGLLTSGAAACLSRVGKRGYLISLASCIAVAGADEIIQYFVPGRACRFTDVLIDTSGAVLGTLAVAAVVRLSVGRKKRVQQKTPDDSFLH